MTQAGTKTQPLHSLCIDFKQDIVDGPFGSELKREDYRQEGTPVLKIQNIKPFFIELKKMDYITPSKFEYLKRHTLAKMGLRKLYPDTIAHALYYALKHDAELNLNDHEFKEIVALDDCVVNVLLFEYATRNKRAKVVAAIKDRANEIKRWDKRDRDKQWLLIYQLWTANELTGNAQGFLAELKTKNFQFLKIPTAKKSLDV